jgi:hypothetical protein
VHEEIEQNLLALVGNVRLGVDKEISRDANDPFVRSAPSSRGQFRSGSVRDVYADHGEIAIIEFPNVRAPATADGLCSVGVWVGAKPVQKHGLRIHAARQSRKPAKKARIK